MISSKQKYHAAQLPDRNTAINTKTGYDEQSAPFLLILTEQEAQLSPRDRAMLCVIEYSAKSL